VKQQQWRRKRLKYNRLQIGSDFRIWFNPFPPHQDFHPSTQEAEALIWLLDSLWFQGAWQVKHDSLAFKAFETAKRHVAWAVDSYTSSSTLRVERFVRWVAGISLLHVVLRHIVRPRSSEERKMGRGPMVPRDRRRVHFTKLSLETLIYFSIEREKHIASWNN